MTRATVVGRARWCYMTDFFLGINPFFEFPSRDFEISQSVFTFSVTFFQFQVTVRLTVIFSKTFPRHFFIFIHVFFENFHFEIFSVKKFSIFPRAGLAPVSHRFVFASRRFPKAVHRFEILVKSKFHSDESAQNELKVVPLDSL